VAAPLIQIIATALRIPSRPLTTPIRLPTVRPAWCR
jgi:hypothetical protein